MQKIYCNSCNSEIDDKCIGWEVHAKINVSDNKGPKGSVRLMVCHFLNRIDLGDWQFDTTDIHFCRDCQLKALKVGVAELK